MQVQSFLVMIPWKTNNALSVSKWVIDPAFMAIEISGKMIPMDSEVAYFYNQTNPFWLTKTHFQHVRILPWSPSRSKKSPCINHCRVEQIATVGSIVLRSDASQDLAMRRLGSEKPAGRNLLYPAWSYKKRTGKWPIEIVDLPNLKMVIFQFAM